MSKQNSHSNRRYHSFGGVLIEAAFSSLLLLLFVAGIVDLARIVHSYIVLTEIAAESARLAGRIMELAQDNPNAYSCSVKIDPPTANCPSCASRCITTVNNSHQEVLDRALFLLDSQPKLDLTGLTASSSRKAKTGTSHEVTVTLTAGYDAFFPLFKGVNIKASHSTEYLYN